MIPFQRRGMYQAAQNVLHGFGSICGASLGGTIANTIGWRWCFLLQVPVSLLALVVGRIVIPLPAAQVSVEDGNSRGLRGIWEQVDLAGALLLILGLSAQLVGLSLGGNDLPWGNIWVVGSLVISVFLLGMFLVVEARTSSAPVMPLRMLQGVLPVSTQIANVCVGMAAYAVSVFQISTWSALTFNLVLVHAPAFLPGCSPRPSIQSRRATGNSFSCDAYRRARLRNHHVSLGKAVLPGAGRSSANVRW